MADPQRMLAAAVSRAIVAALGAELEGVDPVIRPTSNPAFGDFQANFAMQLSKRLDRPSRELAEAVVNELDLGGLCERVEVAGPGFVNLALDDGWVAASVDALLADDRLDVPMAADPERVVVDYSAPNVAKEMHVGHLRSTVIGDALCRVLGWLGHTVVRQNHIGDWGTPFGMLIEHLIDIGAEEGAHELSVGDLTRFYQEARAKFDADPAFVERSRQRVVLLQAGDVATLQLWQLLVDESKRNFNLVYERLGVLLTDADLAPESMYNDRLAGVVTELEEAGLAVVDDGALCVFPPGFTGREGDPLPLIVRYSTGGYGYAATDLAALKYRTSTLAGQRIVYVVGAPQAQHLAMVFAVGAMVGWLGEATARAEHVAFGSVLGADGRMLRTRSGEPVRLIDLLDEAVERARAIVAEKNPSLPAAVRDDVARAIGIGSVKYADLSTDRTRDYVFDWDRMLSFDGNTAAYLLYAYVRVRGIFRRAEGAEDEVSAGDVFVTAPEERSLALTLLRFDAVVQSVAETLEPHRLCAYLFDLAQAYTAFFEACPVLRAPTEPVRRSRLALCELTARTLATGLGLLGITVVEQM
ncbi:MAG TPA: arginine--tRNA ligase [Acidimicrobiales bacterium]|nr:arginine--tRNA ligase [Acidimicrobiales bacterium]